MVGTPEFMAPEVVNFDDISLETGGREISNVGIDDSSTSWTTILGFSFLLYPCDTSRQPNLHTQKR